VSEELGRYKILEKLGQGGFAVVYRAHDTELDRHVALKELRQSLLGDSEGVRRFKREARTIARLNHPRIVTIYDVLEVAQRLFIVMHLVDGLNLDNLITGQGGLPWPQALEILTAVAEALDYAHSQDVLHRDLKPANILLDSQRGALLSDFGLAKLVSEAGSSLTAAGGIVGTPHYIAPEVWEGQGTTSQSDIYALGCVLYQMLTGKKLFPGKSPPAVMMAHIRPLTIPDAWAEEIPSGVPDILKKALAKKPSERYATAGEMATALTSQAEAELQSVILAEQRPRGETLALPGDEEAPHIPLARPGPHHNLPAQTTPFVGREAELTELKDRLQDPACRLLTLVGPGGSGKTRLSLEAAAAQVDNFVHGVYFVRLASLQSVEAMVPTVAEALIFSFYEGGEPRRQLLDYLGQKSMLLILDNFEHLLDGVDLVTDILETAPEVKVLATSRARLNLQGEHLFSVAGMDFPDWETPAAVAQPEEANRYSAVNLFLSSVRRTQPGFEPTADDLADVARICRLVQGMPLGILLAAAWVEMLSPAEIAIEIGHSLDFLETDLHDVPARQRSMRAVCDHSWRLLTENEREAFQALSVFRGGFTRQAAQQVTNASLRVLMGLVNKSLLHHMAKGRYEIHELLRQFAAEKLNESPAASKAARDRHSAYYYAALQQWEAELKGSQQQATLAEMDVEIENARVAWNWTVEQGQVEKLDQAIDGLCHFYEWRGRYQEGEAVCRAAAEQLETTASGDGLRVLAKVLTWQGVFSHALGRPERVSHLLQRSLSLVDRPELANQDTRAEKAFVLLRRGKVAYDSNRKEAGRLYEQSLALYQELDDRWRTANALVGLADVAMSSGLYTKAKQLYEQSLALRQTLNDPKGIADSLMMLGITAGIRGQLEESERLVREGIVICQKMGDRASIGEGLIYLGGTLLGLGKFAEAHSLLEESAAILNDLGSRNALIYSNSILGAAKIHLGQYEQARPYVQIGYTFSREIGYRYVIGYSCYVLGLLALAGEGFAEAQQLLEESVAVYRKVGRQDELGWALAALGITARGLGQHSRAGEHLSQALRIALEFGALGPLRDALPGIALLLADQDEKERAVELYALASRYGYVTNSRWFEDVAGQHIAAVAATLPPDVVAAAQKRGQARDLWATATELLTELGQT
jgi:predicted ATPase/tRNA A-37 threonylcarbamoyl transferase component Bud32